MAVKKQPALMHKRNKTERMVMTSMFAALACVATMVIHIPSPLGGYANLGDTIVLLAAFMLGPLYGAVAAGIGSMMADIFLGYTQYAIVTLVIKSAMAFVSGVLFLHLAGESSATGRKVTASLAAGFVAEVIMIGGYYLFALVFLKHEGAAVLTIPPNAIQALVGMAGATGLLTVLPRRMI